MKINVPRLDFNIADDKLNAAVREWESAAEELDTRTRSALIQAGFGKGAIVRHVHANAHFGNASPNVVESRVVNGSARVGSFSRPGKGEPYLRIQLGRASGKGLSDQFASLDLDHVISCTTSSTIPY